MRRLVPLAVGLVGCANAEAELGEAATPRGVQGLVVVERTEWSVAGEDPSVQSSVSARMIRLARRPATWSQDRAAAERLAGVALERPPVGTCAPVEDELDWSGAPRLDAARLQELGSLELLQASEVRLEADGVSIPLALRAFPDVGASISGVFYTSEDAQLDVPTGAEFTLHLAPWTRSGDAGRKVRAPTALEGASLDGLELAGGEAPLVLRPRAELTWLTPAAQPDMGTGDLILADILSLDGSAVRCNFEDVGVGTLELDGLRESLAPGDDAFVVVRRVRVVELGPASADDEPDVDGLDVRFELSVAARVRVELPQEPAGSAAD